jgi:hypothetical protein
VGDQVANDVIASLGLDPRTIEADKIRALAANLVTNVTAGVIGGVASGGSVTGANAAATTDQFNRQLHPKEIDWIRANARRFAESQRPPITMEEAERRLAQQAFRQVQFGVDGENDPAASGFLRLANNQLLPGDPNANNANRDLGYMFVATPAQRADATMYAATARTNADFYQRNGLKQPTIEQIANAVSNDSAGRAQVARRTILSAFAAGALVLSPAFAGLPAEALLFAKDPVAYCTVSPMACLAGVEAGAGMATGVPVGNSVVPVGTAAGAADRLAAEIQALRGSLSRVPRTSGNMAVAEIEIAGIESRIAASSRIETPSEVERAMGIVGKEKEPIFSTFFVPNSAGKLIPRDGDSEALILNNHAARLGNNTNVNGTVTIFTELPPCSSCTSVVDQFRVRYPNIKIIVIDNSGVRLVTPPPRRP